MKDFVQVIFQHKHYFFLKMKASFGSVRRWSIYSISFFQIWISILIHISFSSYIDFISVWFALFEDRITL
jgi:hypothetical protein